MARTEGFSLVEVILALALAAIAVAAFADAALTAERGAAAGYRYAHARLRAGECLEAARWVRDADGWDALQDGSYGVSSADRWELASEPDVIDGFTRTLDVSPHDADTKLLSCTVAWSESGASRSFAVTTLLAR